MKRPTKLRRDQAGTTFITIAFFMVVLIGFVALSLDVGNVLREQRKAHTATDAGALAGVSRLPDKIQAINDARLIAKENGVTAGEIAASDTGAIQVGWWDSANRGFVAEAALTNAVRVPALRTVPLYFGRVVGHAAMTPAVHSVAVIGQFVVQYGVPTSALDGGVGHVGDTITLERWSPGNWGPLDLCSTNNGKAEVQAAISTASCFASVGETTATSTGFDGVKDGFDDLCSRGADVWMPVVNAFPSGNSYDATIINFIKVHLLCPGSGGGDGFSIQATIVAIGLGPEAQRVLVE